MQLKDNCYFRNFLTCIDKIRRNFSLSAFLGIVIGLAVAVGAYSVNEAKNTSYLVKVNNKSIGYVKHLEDYKKAISSIISTDGDNPVKFMTFEKTKDPVKNFIGSSQIENAARRELGLRMHSVIIYANGIEMAKVEDREAADKALEAVKEYYYPKVSNGTYTIISSRIKEEITFSDTMAYPDEILSIEDAAHKIVNGRGAEKTYTVKEKDTVWDIALKNDLTMEEMKSANPNLNIDRIKPGQVIKLAVNMPYVNVEIVADIKSKEEIPYDTKTIEDKKVAKGVKKLKQEGKNGLADVEKTVTILNDDIVDEKVTKSTVLTSAVDEVVIVGSRVPQYVASGTFIMPSRGTITSRFGYRWGRMHEGVDIAAPRGTPIVAADSGRVSFAGWRNGYGYCVMINHGNGYQTLYGHASKLYVKAGQSVNKGQKIAAVGSTGHSTGPHVHFEVRKNGVLKNPLKYIR